MSAVRELANRYVDQSAVLDPILATSRGVTGYDGEMTDYSPEGHAARTALDRKALGELSQIRPLTEPDRIAVDVMTERLQVAVDQEEAGERLRDLRIIGSPFQSIRQCFDLMATATERDWEIIATRMERVPQALTSFEAALREGLSRGVVAARRQALVCADQGARWSGGKNGSALLTELCLQDAHGIQCVQTAVAFERVSLELISVGAAQPAQHVLLDQIALFDAFTDHLNYQVVPCPTFVTASGRAR